MATGVGEPPSLSGELGETWEPGEGWERAGEGDEEREMKCVMASALGGGAPSRQAVFSHAFSCGRTSPGERTERKVSVIGLSKLGRGCIELGQGGANRVDI